MSRREGFGGPTSLFRPRVLYAVLIFQYTFIMKLVDSLFACFPLVAGTSLIG